MRDVEELVELEKIRKLRVLYSHYLDGKELENLVTLFTEDIVCEFGPYGTWVGRDELREKYQAVYTQRDGSNHQPYQTLHIISNHWIEMDAPDSAVGRCYLVDMLTSHADKSPLRLFGIYDDVYKKAEGAWKIHRTRLDFVWPNRHITSGPLMQRIPGR